MNCNIRWLDAVRRRLFAITALVAAGGACSGRAPNASVIQVSAPVAGTALPTQRIVIEWSVVIQGANRSWPDIDDEFFLDAVSSRRARANVAA